MYANNVSAVDLFDMPGHVDIPRLREGKVGGFFWCVLSSPSRHIVNRSDCVTRSVYVACADPEQEGQDFVNATWRVRYALTPSLIDAPD